MAESRQERNRRLRAEKRQKMIQGMLKRPEPVAPPEETGPFSGPEFDAYKDQGEYGVYLRFEFVLDPTTKKNQIWAYWTHDFTPDFSDAKQFGTIQKIPGVLSTEFNRLLDNLIEKEKYVHIYVDSETLAKDQESFKKLENFLEQWYTGSEELNWEFGSPRQISQEPINVAPKEVKSPSVSPEKYKEYQEQIIKQIRQSKTLYNKYTAASVDSRKKAQDIGIDALARGYDVYSAMEEVTDFLDTVAPLKEGNMPSQPTDIRKLMNVLNELEVAEPTVARPPALDKEESPTDKPGGFNVVIFDDPVTPGYVVWEALMAVLRISQEEAIRRTTAAHDTGAVVATYSQEDVAQTIADRIMAHAQANTNWDFLRNLPNVPRYPRGPGGYQGPWPLQAEVMPAGN